MIKLLKEELDNSEKKEIISNYENKLKEVDTYIDTKLNDVIESIKNLKNSIKYDVITDEISSFYIDDDSLSLYEDELDDEIESDELAKEVNNFISMSNNDIDYIIEDSIMKLFQ